GQVADVGAQAEADAGPDGGERHAAGLLIVHAQAADEIGRALDAREALEDRHRVVQVVAEREDPAGVAAEVPADRRALPEHLHRLATLHVEQAAAVAGADGQRARALL